LRVKKVLFVFGFVGAVSILILDFYWLVHGATVNGCEKAAHTRAWNSAVTNTAIAAVPNKTPSHSYLVSEENEQGNEQNVSIPIVESALSSGLLLGKPVLNKVYLTIGIPTVTRPTSQYLKTTLQSLINSSVADDRREVVIVVLLCDTNATNRANTLAMIRENFASVVAEGSLQVAQLVDEQRSATTSISRRTYNDSAARVRWRSKQVLDFAFLLRYCANMSRYFMLLDDDVVAAPDFISAVREFIELQAGDDWVDLQFSNFLAIGRLYRAEYLPKLSALLRTFYAEQPVDILLEHFRAVMAPALAGEKVVRRPSLFQHIGKASSLPNKVQDLMDVTYGTAPRQFNGDNPPAVTVTNITMFQSYHLMLAYAKAPGMFWGREVRKGAEIYVILKRPVPLSRVVVATGNKEHPKDILYNGKMDVSKRLIYLHGNRVHCEDFNYVGSFDDGLLDITDFYRIFPYSVQCLRIIVLSNQEAWLIVREIAVFVKKLLT
ncbi:PREDICTED: alpha-1,3-mannosyl-glycoprotein 4-beta-N-acetylglucosaminyltransferase C-like, partial [Priapulus caudatus]|uniref:Alpha-1,3-mannosyl-glycoprotein 4-beta-N-acetylglucosaminyltransferase C-like n=1 Tax=Priapulus caudatus TaxID=37621 RepID=A0ABM1E0B4_PRICU